jgi:RNA polymerase sigma-70 factor (ECF subfamily)
MAVNVEMLYRKYGPMVMRRCRAILKDEEAARDAMQETFVAVLRKADSLHDTAPSSMLYTFATRVSLSLARHQGRSPQATDPNLLEETIGKEDFSNQILTRQFIERLFTSEPASTKEIARLHYQEQYSLDETAEKVGMSKSGVRRRLRNLRKRGYELVAL